MRIIEGKLMGNFCEVSLFLLFDAERGMLKLFIFCNWSFTLKTFTIKNASPFFWYCIITDWSRNKNLQKKDIQ